MLNTTTFQQSLERLNDDYQKVTFLVAVSGGADSMVLFNLFKLSDLQFQVAHINYGLRGSNSDKDQKLVEKVCEKNEIPFHLYKVSEKDNQPENSIQTWARELRYHFFRKIQQKENLDLIATAHHLNDQLETFIINLSKASGIKGLSGIPANENGISRPLLSFSKDDIYQYAKEHHIEFREDLSNQKNDYLRNRIRNEIVPKLMEVNENFLKNFGKSVSYLNQTKNFVDEKVSEIEKKLIINKEGISIINKKLLFNQTDFIQFEVLRKFGFKELQEIRKIKKAETGKKFISEEYHLTVDRETLILEKLANEVEELIVTEIILELNADSELIIPEHLNHQIKELGSFDWKIDKAKVQLPLKLRRKKDGDLFHPIGMIGKKKISKFFKDEKIPILAQQKIWLLCDGNNQVLGVIPYRQDRRFAPTKASSEIITVKL